ncbi:dUTP diphosphatase [Rothia sp. HMSC066G02]|uniref:dUTP diphosphatase n=1 Tax=Rothia sp. HMSC066G02 TaxID=1739398 RepID=UPI0008A21A90|nr:dUTP diphosphatase [Rothia sp. HMSC066G02]OFR27981.1 deoxyuridine 5'-triphosphate nucleotidohydrolase [Rothia sp. HMSC066G02]
MTMMNPVNVHIKLLDPELPAPAYAKPGDAGADLRSRIDFELEPGERALVPTGVAIALPEGYVGLVHPRSGLATKNGITIVNAPGTVDSGYRGELMVTLLNTDKTKSFHVQRGDRIAQLVIQKYEHATFTVVDELEQTERGSSGFGSSGIH